MQLLLGPGHESLLTRSDSRSESYDNVGVHLINGAEVVEQFTRGAIGTSRKKEESVFSKMKRTRSPAMNRSGRHWMYPVGVDGFLLSICIQIRSRFGLGDDRDLSTGETFANMQDFVGKQAVVARESSDSWI